MLAVATSMISISGPPAPEAGPAGIPGVPEPIVIPKAGSRGPIYPGSSGGSPLGGSMVSAGKTTGLILFIH